MPQAGLLVQLDGSHHAWLESRGPRLVVLAALFRLAEDTPGYLLLLRLLLHRYGVPAAVYSDRHSIFAPPVPTRLTLAEQFRGTRDPTQLGRALQELGIGWIGARSPQAKGRIERLFGTFQDRLVAELRLAKAQTLADAQRVLSCLLPRYNAALRPSPRGSDPGLAPSPIPQILETICCLKYQRTVANDNTIQVGERLLHLRPGPGGRSDAHSRVSVHLRSTGRSRCTTISSASRCTSDPPPPRGSRPIVHAIKCRPRLSRPPRRQGPSRRRLTTRGGSMPSQLGARNSEP